MKLKPRFPKYKWHQLSEKQKNEIKKEFYSWAEDRLKTGTWQLHAISLGSRGESVSWSVSFDGAIQWP